MDDARKAVSEALEKCLKGRHTDWNKIKLVIRDAMNDYIWKKTKRRPMVIPIIMHVDDMIVDERIITFINSMDTENSEILETIEQEALAADVPIIRREMQSFLEVLLLMKKPMRVLEVGTAVGFSALLMSDYLPEGGHITTIENYEKRIPIARENFRRAGKEDKITLIEGDATEVLAEMEGTFDFIFMDAAKGQYIHYLPNVLRLLSDGGCLVSDNVMDLVTSIIPLGDGVAVSIKQGVEK